MKQEGGHKSTNIQVKGNYNNGLSYSDARQVALDVFKANYYELSKEAMETVNSRLTLITDNIIKKVYTELTDKVERLKEPSIQSSIYEVQKEYVKTGDDILGSQLTNILIERIKTEDRTLKQIALDEAIKILPKLTNTHIDLLTLNIVLIHLSRFLGVNSIKSFMNSLESHIFPFCHNNIKKADVTHLQSCGCLSLLPEGGVYKQWEELLQTRYLGIFNHGFTEEEVKASVSNDLSLYRRIVQRCLQDSSKFQFNSLNELSLRISTFTENNIDNSIQQKIIDLFNSKVMSQQEIKNFILSKNNEAQIIFKIWDETNIKAHQLTPTGTVIALINFNMKTNESYSIDGWITIE